jgi:hypothetical protein
MPSVLICHRRADDAEAQRLLRVVRERVRHDGVVLVADDEVLIEPGDGTVVIGALDRLADLVEYCGLCLVLVTPRWQDPDARRRLFDPHDGVRQALRIVKEHDVPVATIVAGEARRLDHDELPGDVTYLASRGHLMHLDDDRGEIVSFVKNVLARPEYADLTRPGTAPLPPLLAPYRPTAEVARWPAPVPAGHEPAVVPESPPLETAPVAEPVLLGASAPRGVRPGDEFTARLVAYVAADEEAVRDQLAGLSPRAATHFALHRCRWQPGTVATVTLSARGMFVEPAVQRFTWEGQRQLVEFDVQVPDTAASGVVVLKFDVAVEGIVVARVRLDVEIGPQAPGDSSAPSVSAPVKAATTAFASYASLDRDRVLDRVAAVEISAGLDVFVDCLSLHPGEVWKARLEEQIANRDLFLLFWSQHAADSSWVTWEWQTALDRKGLDAMQIHPLATDVPPPEPLRQLHFGDIHMLARDRQPPAR